MNATSHNPLEAQENVLGQIRAEHREMQALLDLLVIEPSSEVREHLQSRVCGLARLHFTLEAGVIVPAVAGASANPQLLEHTGVAFARLLQTINELEATPAGNYRPTLVTELAAQIKGHIEAAESENGFLNQAIQLALDWRVIEMKLATRREQLLGQEWFHRMGI